MRGYRPLASALAIGIRSAVESGGWDIAVVQVGLTTTLGLTANRRAFLYFPLRHHFEQNFHVPIVSAATAPDGAWTSSVKDPDEITRALATELTRQVDYLRVEI